MSKLPSMPFFVADYLGDTTHLKTVEHGAYLLILFAMWAHGGTISDDDHDLAKICRLHLRDWRKMKPRIMPFLMTYGPENSRLLTNKKLQIVWNYAQDRRAKQVEKGIKSGEARRGKSITSHEPQLNRSSNHSSTAVRTVAEPSAVQAQVEHHS